MSKLRNTISNLFHPTASLRNNNVDNIFNNIYGRDDIKHIIQMALESEQPVHVLLTGKPGCGKTQFLENIKGHYKDKAYFTIGAHSTKAGMLDYLFEKRPRFLLIDEIEHMPAKDQAVLLMQSQILSETKYGKTRQTQLKCSIFVTSNSTKKMLDPLLSRFVIIKVEKYSYEEFKEVAMRVLMEREFIEDENLARAIVNKVWQKSSANANIRDVIKIARLAKNMHDIDLVSWASFL
ncbi:MAG TPA: AAA family ATPase [Nitrososphaeraceae archaeon]|nr:AAA family ATPase [Nitrososphaeraceae archaeon]